jgi:hypothetical protein
MQKIPLSGAAMGELMIRNLQVNPRYTAPYWPGTWWYESFDFQRASFSEITVAACDLRSRLIYAQPAATAPHLDSTIRTRSCGGG